jgi:hypothetical protein
VFAAVDDVAREASEAKGEFAAKVEKRADKNENGSEEEKRPAQVAKVHGRILSGSFKNLQRQRAVGDFGRVRHR